MNHLVTISLVAFVLAALAMIVTALVSRRVGRVSVVDIAWGLGLTVIALACALLSSALSSADRGWLPWLLLALTAVWGCRLAWHIYRRSRGKGEDPRYAELLGDGGFAAAVRKVFLIQGMAIWFVSWPLQAAAVASSTWVWLVALGALVWLVGFVFESVGDAQLETYKALPPDQRPQVLDTGLWGWTRHPNYFGDACVWWGLWLAGGLSSGWLAGLITIPAPIAMTYFLAYATGAKPLEKTMMQRPGYPAYAERVPMLLPRPPRR
ncbi:MAG: DUF1295 domain-containing protein [Nocardioides sp.]